MLVGNALANARSPHLPSIGRGEQRPFLMLAPSAHRLGPCASRAARPPPWAFGAAITDLPLGGSSHLSRRWSLMARAHALCFGAFAVRPVYSVYRTSAQAHLPPAGYSSRPPRVPCPARRAAPARGREIRFVTERAPRTCRGCRLQARCDRPCSEMPRCGCARGDAHARGHPRH